MVDIDGIGEATATGSSWSGGGGRMFLVCGWIEVACRIQHSGLMQRLIKYFEFFARPFRVFRC